MSRLRRCRYRKRSRTEGKTLRASQKTLRKLCSRSELRPLGSACFNRRLADVDGSEWPVTAYGRAKTYTALPLAGGRSSGAIVDGTWRGLPPPRPVVTAMYCFPSTLKETGKPCTEVPRRVFHTIAPVLTSTD